MAEHGTPVRDVANLKVGRTADWLAGAKEQGWLGEVAAIETTMAAAAQKPRRRADTGGPTDHDPPGHTQNSTLLWAIPPEHVTHPANRTRRTLMLTSEHCEVTDLPERRCDQVRFVTRCAASGDGTR